MKTASTITIIIGIILFALYLIFEVSAFFGLSAIVLIFGLIMKPEKPKQKYKSIHDACSDMNDLKK